MSASSRSSLAGKRGEMTATALALAIAIGAGSGAAAGLPPRDAAVACIVAVRPAADGKSGAMLMTLPFGLNLTEPVLVKVDNGTPERQAIQTCTNVGCFAAMTLSDKLIAAMRTAGELKITVQDANKVEMILPLLGFGLAFDKAK
jgi:invasion protein IalB